MSASQTAETTSMQMPPAHSNGKSQRAPRSRGKKRAARTATARAAAPAADAPATAASPEAAPATAAKAPAARTRTAKTQAAQAPAARAIVRTARPSDDAGQRSFPVADGLFQMLPNPGTPWTLDEGVVWLQAVAATLRLAYKFPGTLTVTGTQAA